MRRLYNPSSNTIHAMYDGQPYVIPARGVCHCPDHVAEHFALYYMRHGVRILRDDEPVPQETEEGEGEAGPEETEAEHLEEHECDECGQKFGSDRALKMHKRRAHAAATADI